MPLPIAMVAEIRARECSGGVDNARSAGVPENVVIIPVLTAVIIRVPNWPRTSRPIRRPVPALTYCGRSVVVNRKAVRPSQKIVKTIYFIN